MDTLLGATLQKNLVERNAGAEAALRSCLAAHKDDVLWSQFRREVEIFGVTSGHGRSPAKSMDHDLSPPPFQLPKWRHLEARKAWFHR